MHRALVTGPLEHPGGLWWVTRCLVARVVGDPSVGCAQGSHPGPPAPGWGEPASLLLPQDPGSCLQHQRPHLHPFDAGF